MKSEAFFPPHEDYVREVASGFHIALTGWKVEEVVVRLVERWIRP